MSLRATTGGCSTNFGLWPVLFLISFSWTANAQCPSGHYQSVSFDGGTLYAYPMVRGIPQIGETSWLYCVEAANGTDLEVTSFAVSECMLATDSGTWSGDPFYPVLEPGGGDPETGLDPGSGISGVHFRDGIPGGDHRQYYYAVNGDYLLSSSSVTAQTSTESWAMQAAGPDPICNQTIALPVEMTSFSVTRNGEFVVLQWETVSEHRNSGFIVESAADGNDFEQIGFVEGAGSANSLQRYRFDTPNPGPGYYRFRLGQLDFDGTVTYSNEVELESQPDRYLIGEPYPNPFNPETALSVTVSETQQVRADIYDMSGRALRNVLDRQLGSGNTHHLKINANGLPSGIYVVRITGERFVADRNIVLSK